jgi:hypothetical protein
MRQDLLAHVSGELLHIPIRTLYMLIDRQRLL